jgi:hypothetical protein
MKLTRTPIRPQTAEGQVNTLTTSSTAFVATAALLAARTAPVVAQGAPQRPRNPVALQSSSFGGVSVVSTQPHQTHPTMHNTSSLAAASSDLQQSLRQARQTHAARQSSAVLTVQQQLERTAVQLVKHHPQWGAAAASSSIAEMEKILGTHVRDRKFVEVAASLYGPGARDLIGNEEPIDEVIGKLGYATTEGVNSLCDLKEDCDQLMLLRKSTDEASNDVDTVTNRAEQKALMRQQQSVALAVGRAIQGGQKLGNVIGDKAHQCNTIDAIRAVCDVKAERDWQQRQLRA